MFSLRLTPILLIFSIWHSLFTGGVFLSCSEQFIVLLLFYTKLDSGCILLTTTYTKKLLEVMPYSGANRYLSRTKTGYNRSILSPGWQNNLQQGHLKYVIFFVFISFIRGFKLVFVILVCSSFILPIFAASGSTFPARRI